MNVILYYSPATHLGGAERSLVELVSRLAEESSGKYSPLVVLPKSEGPLVDVLSEKKVPFQLLPMPNSILKITRQNPLSWLKIQSSKEETVIEYLRELRKFIKRCRPSLIHSNGFKCHFLGVVAGVSSRTPVLWHLRDIYSKGLIRFGLRTASHVGDVHVVANSAATAKSFSENQKKVSVIYNGLDPTEFFPGMKTSVFRDHWKVGSEVPIIGVVGALARWKGQLEFLKMAKSLLSAGINARFVVAGDEIYDTMSDLGYGKELKAEAERLQISDHVLFTGFIKNPIEAYRGLDIAVHTSLKPEPFGRVIIEAMACAVPVVAAEDGGVLEIVTDGQDGLLYPPGNVDAMAARVESLVQSRELRNKLTENGRETFLNRFTVHKHVVNMIGLYDKIISART